jgi:hypothetical protein
VIRVATLNLWMRSGDWPARRRVLRDGFAALAPDVVGFQEVETGEGGDSVSVTPRTAGDLDATPGRPRIPATRATRSRRATR